MVMCFNFYPEAGGWLSSECLSLLVSIEFGEIQKMCKQVEQGGKLGKKLEWKIQCILLSYFIIILNISHLVHFTCHCQNTLLCIFQHVIQVTHFTTGVEKYDRLYLLSV